MMVKVQLFAAGRDAVGAGLIEVRLTSPATIGNLRLAMADQHPSLQPILAQAIFAMNEEYASDESTVTEAAELALIPPVSGG